MSPRLARLSFGVLALAIPVWWVAMGRDVAFRALFVPSTEWATLRSFLVPDLALAVLAAAAAMMPTRGRTRGLLAAAATGGWGYATIWTCSAWVVGTVTAASAVSMLIGAGIVIIASYALVSSSVDC